jgi:hypothetical protein
MILIIDAELLKDLVAVCIAEIEGQGAAATQDEHDHRDDDPGGVPFLRGGRQWFWGGGSDRFVHTLFSLLR